MKIEKKAVVGELSEFGLERVEEFKLSFLKYSDKELAEKYFQQQKVGITGVAMQNYFIIALKSELEKRFGQSPIEFDGQILEL
ncbi:MAG: hypothetical protein H7174_10035 [Flavobacterium sp.]|nr:hypothetical protein [Flavobacterium sp.]